jgi:hypothetical protein
LKRSESTRVPKIFNKDNQVNHYQNFEPAEIRNHVFS